MLYLFIINGREDIRSKVDAALDAQLPSLDIEYRKYYSHGVGDATRAVRLYSDLHPKDEVCFVACGGSGTVNEVASGVVGFESKYLAILAFGETNDVVKYYPGLDFTDLSKLVSGRMTRVDIMKAGDNYGFNIINVGFESMVAYTSARYMERGVPAVKAYRRAVLASVLTQRLHRIDITLDGKPLGRKRIMSAQFANGHYCGGQYKSAPRAVNDDGLMDALATLPMSLPEFAVILSHYTAGTHLDNAFCMRRMKYARVKHVSLTSKNLIYLCLDGEFVASTHFDIDILPGEINLLLPLSENNE